jgi:RNA polymerase sigma-70 factor (ECF subfamily)
VTPAADQIDRYRDALEDIATRLLGSDVRARLAVGEAERRIRVSEEQASAALLASLSLVVTRVCIAMLQSKRAATHSEPLATDRLAGATDGDLVAADLGLLADPLVLSLLVVLEALSPAERLAFLLRDMLALSCEETARVIGRSRAETRRLIRRARWRVRTGAVE